MDKRFDLKDLHEHLNIQKSKIKLFKVESCGNPEVNDEGNKDHQWHNFFSEGKGIHQMHQICSVVLTVN